MPTTTLENTHPARTANTCNATPPLEKMGTEEPRGQPPPPLTAHDVELGEFYSEPVTRPDLWSDVCGAYTAASIVMALIWRPY